MNKGKEMKKRYFDNYVSTIFKQAHPLDDSEYTASLPAFDRYLYPYLPKDRNISICDIGCGSGFFLYYLKQKKYTNICGVDISAEQIKQCKSKGLQNVHAEDGIKFLKRNKEKFDLIFCSNLLEHLTTEKLYLLLAHVYRALKKNGRALIAVPNATALFSPFLLYIDITHERLFTPISLKQVLSLAGFSKIKIHALKPLARGLRSLMRRYLYFFLCFFYKIVIIVELGYEGYKRFQPIYFSSNILGIAEKV
ncbi:MAG: class I SAM-dependent methyltransferase [Spirochaetales bacterium]|nr:class I SAM-dependent methyltransferase [Spirochaetales bacterium]